MPKTIVGIVSSNSANKTIVVSVERQKTHPLYHKQYKVTDKFMAHDEKNEALVGDKVLISENRPLSARKHFILTEILEKPTLRADQLSATKVDENTESPEKDKE